ncbi:MAG: SDR family oxidoreductase [Actinobacteria bacterium]|nr:MAG: SDR family oxidoreductase [Actinomycetota bacterium]
MSFDLSGRSALVTGSTRGLGLALARALAEAGARVAVNGRSAEAAAEVAASIDGAVAAAFDVTDEAAVATAVGELGPVDVLVNNAGGGLRKPLLDVSLEEWRSALDANLTSAYLVARAVAPGMIERGSGKVVNICSVMSELARETIAPYTAAKGGLKMLTRAMCSEWARHGIQANAIAPGYFETDMTEALRTDAAFDAWLRARVPAGRWGQPDELGGAVVFLASSASDYVNGQILYVDGGLTAVV